MIERATPPPSETDVRRLLGEARGPAIVVDATRARLLGANPAGAAMLGLAGDGGAGLDIGLDAAMPATIRLALLARSPMADTPVDERLTFWTRRGTTTLDCRVAWHDAGPGRRLALVALAPVDGPPKSGDADREADHSDAQPVAKPVRDDADTLREIARRIREGQMLRDSNRAHAAAAKDDETGAGDVVGNAPTRPDGPRSLRLAKLAHELKTPLSAIVAAAEIMRDERLGPIENPRYRSYSADIYDSARHALMVIGNMLGDGAQALDVDGSACLPPMVFAEIAVADIVESCVSSMRPLAERAGLALTTEAPERLPHVIADATAVRQIVLNLLNNAVKFTRPGGAIRLALRYWPDGPLEIEIADTGRGMTAEEIARAGPAAADQGVSRREGGGFGIGLPLVGALARANGAGVSFVSVPGEGTRVVVAFGRDRVVPV